MMTKPSIKGEKISETEVIAVDRLSSLPDSLISHILSFLPTKQVVATSILAKSWRNLWMYFSNIIFDNVRYRRMGICQIVYRLLLQQKAQCLKKMFLHSNSMAINENDVSNWIATGIERGIQNVDLGFSFKFSPPPRLFNCHTLVKLNMLSAVITSMSALNAPFLPSLKELHLQNLTFSSEFLKRVIIGCPALECLFLSVARDNVAASCEIFSSTLKRLELLCEGSPLEMLTQKIVLSVPALEFLRIHYPSPQIVVEDKLSCLVEADIRLFQIYEHGDNIFHASIPKFINALSNVMTLKLSIDLKRPMKMALQDEFPNLTKLDISSYSFEFILLQCFMENSINLEMISFEKVCNIHIKVTHQISWNEPQQVPKCFLSSLRKIVIKGYRSKSELDMVKYVLGNGEVLERMEIHFSDLVTNYELKYHMIREIVVLARASRRCEVSML